MIIFESGFRSAASILMQFWEGKHHQKKAPAAVVASERRSGDVMIVLDCRRDAQIAAEKITHCYHSTEYPTGVGSTGRPPG